jgi:mannose-6-phosphate isomerase-like protein (cupin superfamily)
MRDANNMNSSAVHVGSGEGRTVRMAKAQLITRKVSREQTGGAYSLFEVAVDPGGRELSHVQHREDECFYVLEGEFEFVIEGARIEAGIGSLIYVPRGNLHAFQNMGEMTGRMLVSQTPGGAYEGFVEEVGELATGRVVPLAVEQASDAERLVRVGVEYGIEVEPPSPVGKQHGRDDHLGGASDSRKEAGS